MKKKSAILAFLGVLAPLTSLPTAQAVEYGRHRGGHHNYYNNHHYYPYYYYPYYSPGYNYYCYYGSYGCQYYMESTDSNFRSDPSETQSTHRDQVYLKAAKDAANFLKNGGEESPALREAIKTEREIAAKSGIEEAKSFDQQTLAQIVLGRAEKLTNSDDGTSSSDNDAGETEQ